MSTSKARFQAKPSASKAINGSKASSTGVGGVVPGGGGGVAGSKRGNQAQTGASPTKSSSNIQVIFNGKIVTPQSLIPRRPTVSTSTMRRGAGVDTIPENAPESPDKHQHGAKSKKHPGEVGSERMPMRLVTHGSALAMAGKAVEEMTNIVLTETSTETIFNLPSLIAASDVREVALVTDRNKRYEMVVETHKTAADSFLSRPTQTLNHTQKNQSETAAPSAQRDYGSQVTAYEISDSTSQDKRGYSDADAALGLTADEGNKDAATASVQKFVEDTVNVCVVTPGCLLDVDYVGKPPAPGETRKEGGKVKKGAPGGASAVSGALTSGLGFGTSAAGGGSMLAASASGMGAGSESDAGQVSQSQTGIGGAPNASSSRAGGSDNFSGAEGADYGGGGNVPEQDSAQILREKQAEGIMSSPMLLKRLQMIERAVQQNAYHRQQLDYRDLPDVPPLDIVTSDKPQVVESVDQLFGGFGGGLGGMLKAGGAATTSIGVGDTHGGGEDGTGEGSTGGRPDESLEEEDGTPKKAKKLFNFYYADLVQGRSVTTMAWNAVNCDLLAVGYGKLDIYTEQHKLGEVVDEQLQGGLVLFWSLRNPEYPEKTLRTPYPVTAVDFSINSPMTLAVGQSNGDINIYDVKRDDWRIPIESSGGISGGHSDPVWQLKWIVRGVERTETLVSISTDGAVLEWNMKKGLVMSTLMQLKRGEAGEGWISRQAAGFSFDFLPHDLTTYVVGTEEGSLHKCSVSYNEQYLETYEGHEAPVYQVRFSTRCPNIFLTCSADWGINLYNVASRKPIVQMRATGEDFSINDINWCPDNSTVFAACTSDSKLQIWDLEVSTIDPVVCVDTSVDDVVLAQAQAKLLQDEMRAAASATSPPATPAAPVVPRYDRHEKKEEEREPPMAKLIRNLTLKADGKRVLTRVLFGARSPTVVVGDNKGAVTVYRVLQPSTITHLGPLQQAAKLMRVVTGLGDVAEAAEGGEGGDDGASGVASGGGTSAAAGGGGLGTTGALGSAREESM